MNQGWFPYHRIRIKIKSTALLTFDGNWNQSYKHYKSTARFEWLQLLSILTFA
uniref:Uncharacterized protein n=1 Tax=Arundo donax TaxID=35708 RepID=A0A0A9FK58_ARUDO